MTRPKLHPSVSTKIVQRQFISGIVCRLGKALDARYAPSAAALDLGNRVLGLDALGRNCLHREFHPHYRRDLRQHRGRPGPNVITTEILAPNIASPSSLAFEPTWAAHCQLV
jgi:hypothetical protein